MIVILRRPQGGRLEGRQPGPLILRGSLRSHLRMTVVRATASSALLDQIVFEDRHLELK